MCINAYSLGFANRAVVFLLLDLCLRCSRIRAKLELPLSSIFILPFCRILVLRAGYKDTRNVYLKYRHASPINKRRRARYEDRDCNDLSDHKICLIDFIWWFTASRDTKQCVDSGRIKSECRRSSSSLSLPTHQINTTYHVIYTGNDRLPKYRWRKSFMHRPDL